MARGISSIVTIAVVTGAVGFGAGVYLVPNEKADQFRTIANEKANQFRSMVQSGLGAIYRVVYSDKANADFHPSEPSQTEPPGETSRTEAQPDIPAGSQPGLDAQCDPVDSKCRGGLPVDAAAPQAIPDRDVAVPSSSPLEHDDQPSHALNTDPSGTVPPNSSPNIESDAPTPVVPEAAKKKRSAKKVNPKSGPSE